MSFRVPFVSTLCALGLGAAGLTTAPQVSLHGSTLNGCTPYVRPRTPTTPGPLLAVEWRENANAAGQGFRLDLKPTQEYQNPTNVRAGDNLGGVFVDYTGNTTNLDAVLLPTARTYFSFENYLSGQQRYLRLTGEVNGTAIQTIDQYPYRGTYEAMNTFEEPRIVLYGEDKARILVDYYGMRTAITLVDK